VSPTVIQALAQTRIDDFVRAADRRRRMSAANAARAQASSAPKPIRPRRRLRFGFA
jgi:hypothetical protein